MDEASIGEFVRTECPRLVAALSYMLGSRAAAEDAVQEALARAWERSARGEEIHSPKAWVMAVATNLLRSRLRRLRTERRVQQIFEGQALSRAGLSGTQSIAALEDRLDLWKALAALPRRQREVTVLRYYADLDVAQIARVLRIRDGSAKSSLHQARQALAAALGEDEKGEVNHVARR